MSVSSLSFTTLLEEKSLSTKNSQEKLSVFPDPYLFANENASTSISSRSMPQKDTDPFLFSTEEDTSENDFQNHDLENQKRIINVNLRILYTNSLTIEIISKMRKLPEINKYKHAVHSDIDVKYLRKINVIIKKILRLNAINQEESCFYDMRKLKLNLEGLNENFTISTFYNFYSSILCKMNKKNLQKIPYNILKADFIKYIKI